MVTALQLRLALVVLLLASSRGSDAADGPPTPLRNADGSCAIHPNSHWDLDVSSLPVHPSSA